MEKAIREYVEMMEERERNYKIMLSDKKLPEPLRDYFLDKYLAVSVDVDTPEYKALVASIPSANDDEYKTVEGHPIIRGGEYKTRGGSMVTITRDPIQFSNGRISIWGKIEGMPDEKFWNQFGLLKEDEESNFDLMRPWKIPSASTKNVSASTSIDTSEGMIRHDGENQPVLDGVLLDVKYKGGEYCPYVESNVLEWFWGQEDTDEYDIQEYRLYVPKVKPIVEEKKPEKQTLIEHMDESAGYNGEAQSKEDKMRRDVYLNISEYLEQQDD